MKKIYIMPLSIVANANIENTILEGSVQGLGDDSGVKPGWSDDDDDDDDPRAKDRNTWKEGLW